MPKFNKFTISNLLILLSAIFTIVGYLNPDFIREWSINTFYLYEKNYFHWFLQFFTGTFIHGGILHIFMNSFFIYYYGNILEKIMGKKIYIIFFILFCIFNGIMLSIFDPYHITIGISGFAMAVLAYLTLYLKDHNNTEYKGGITAILINIAIGFYPGISFYGHLFGAIFGIIFYYLTNDFFKRQIVGLFTYFRKNKKVASVGTFNTKKD